jgi:hypothetical protein
MCRLWVRGHSPGAPERGAVAMVTAASGKRHLPRLQGGNPSGQPDGARRQSSIVSKDPYARMPRSGRLTEASAHRSVECEHTFYDQKPIDCGAVLQFCDAPPAGFKPAHRASGTGQDPRLPPENPCQVTTTSDKSRSTRFGVSAVQRWNSTTCDKSKIATAGNRRLSTLIIVVRRL